MGIPSEQPLMSQRIHLRIWKKAFYSLHLCNKAFSWKSGRNQCPDAGRISMHCMNIDSDAVIPCVNKWVFLFVFFCFVLLKLPSFLIIFDQSLLWLYGLFSVNRCQNPTLGQFCFNLVRKFKGKTSKWGEYFLSALFILCIVFLYMYQLSGIDVRYIFSKKKRRKNW